MPRFGVGDRAQSSAARALKVTPGTINRLLKGPGGGSLDLIERAAKFLNEDPDWILKGTEAKRPMAKKLRELAGFDAAMGDAVRRIAAEHPFLSRFELEAAADVRADPEPAIVTAGLLINVALAMRIPEHSPESTGTRQVKTHRRH